MWSMLSEKEKKVCAGFKFRKDKNTKEGTRWRCVKQERKSFIVTDYAGKNFIRGPVHNHLYHFPDDNLSRELICNRAKVEAKKDISLQPKKIVGRQLLNAPDYIREQILQNDMFATRRSVYETRASLHPPLPKNVDEVFNALDILEAKNQIKIAGGAKSLLINDRENKIVVFDTAESLRFL